nr:hypothetical protein [Tanacetum cinerariifolium]
MHGIGKTVNELHSMLKLHEQTLPKKDTPALHVIRAGKGLRKSSKLKPGALTLYVGNGSRKSTQKDHKIATSDLGGEYMSQEFIDHLKEHGIISHRTPLYTPQYNGVLERKNRTLLNMVRSMMSQTTLPKSFWNYALEIAAHILNMVPTKKVLVNLPPDGKTVGSKWLFKKKSDMDGVVHTYKAHLIAKGFTQTYGVDYEETFSSIAYIRAIRILISIVAFYDYEIWQMDVKSAFLNGYLSEERFHMENSKRESIPMQEKLEMSKSQGTSTPAELKRVQNVPYASTVGSIMYAVRCTRPDVAFAHNITSRFQQNPGNIKRELRVSCYTHTGYLTDVRKFNSRLGVVPTIEKPIKMYCDNTGAIAIPNESKITKGARHFCAKVYYLHEVNEYGDIKLEKVHTYDNLADPFTKVLAFPKHSEHTKNIGMLSAGSLM